MRDELAEQTKEVHRLRVLLEDRTALFTEITHLLRVLRTLCIALIVLMVIIGVLLTSISQSNRRGIDRVDKSFHEFATNNQKYLDNNARTQRLACAQLRALGTPVPVNPTTHKSDCEGR